MNPTRKAVMESVTEAEWLGFVTTLARTLGHDVYHTHDSRSSTAGFPDLCMVRDGRLIFAELKSERGKVSAAQQEWLDALAKVDGIEVYVWRPSQQDEVIALLRGDA